VTSTNVDFVRSIFAAWEHGDYGSADWASPEIEYVHADGPDPGSWTGLAEMASAFGDWMSAWQDYRADADRYLELDDERVIVFYRRSGRGKASGVELGQVQAKGAILFDVRDGRVRRLVHYLDRDRAIADLGLSPEDS
jgi:ketosteroid isomerase-like protein